MDYLVKDYKWIHCPKCQSTWRHYKDENGDYTCPYCGHVNG